jgi:hypothetical protein
VTRVAFILAMVMVCGDFSANADSIKNTPVYGYGGWSCGKWLKANPAERRQLLIWVFGFLSGVNATSPDRSVELPGNITGSNDADVEVYLSKFCVKHPFEQFATAAASLAKDMSVPSSYVEAPAHIDPFAALPEKR